MHELDMGDFDEHTKPLYTDAKDSLIEKSLTPAERFYREWSRGLLPLPFITCGATQLYDAYKVWCEKSGESRYISQTLFSPTITRYAGDALDKKVIKYEYGSVVKQRHVFVVGDKPEGQTLSDWVSGASNLFDSHLKKYRSRASVDVDS
jgi:phage/plasmid-associated DNA primase